MFDRHTQGQQSWVEARPDELLGDCVWNPPDGASRRNHVWAHLGCNFRRSQTTVGEHDRGCRPVSARCTGSGRWKQA